jgi:hypothetical protein
MRDGEDSLSQCMIRRPSVALIAAFAVAVALRPVFAQSRERGADFDEDRKPWKEIEAKIPPYPSNPDLVSFDPGGGIPHRYYLDARSLSIGEDGVVRYTLVVKTAGGATSVSFEGIRCESREQKYYAAGGPHGAWLRARNPQWRSIGKADPNQRHHNVLYSDFFCDDSLPVRTVREMLERFRSRPAIVD